MSVHDKKKNKKTALSGFRTLDLHFSKISANGYPYCVMKAVRFVEPYLIIHTYI